MQASTLQVDLGNIGPFSGLQQEVLQCLHSTRRIGRLVQYIFFFLSQFQFIVVSKYLIINTLQNNLFTVAPGIKEFAARKIEPKKKVLEDYHRVRYEEEERWRRINEQRAFFAPIRIIFFNF